MPEETPKKYRIRSVSSTERSQPAHWALFEIVRGEEMYKLETAAIGENPVEALLAKAAERGIKPEEIHIFR